MRQSLYEWLMMWTPIAANLVVTFGGLFVVVGWWWGRRAARVPFYKALKRAQRDGADVWLNRGRDDEFIGTVEEITDRTVVFNDGYGELVEWDLSLIRTQERFRQELFKSAGIVFEIGRVGHPLVDISGSRALSRFKLEIEKGRCSFTVEENERTSRLFWSMVGKRYRCRFSAEGKDVGLPYIEFEARGSRSWGAKRRATCGFDVMLRLEGEPVRDTYPDGVAVGDRDSP